MPKTSYDVVIVGAGLNGLVAAAYLARSGKSVFVAERRATLGGAASTDEFAPGFRSSLTFPSAELFHPDLLRELELEAHGLEWKTPRGGVFLPASGGEGLFASGDLPGSIAPEDRAALHDLEAFLRRLGRALEPALTRPLPELRVAQLGDVTELLTLGFRLRGLGKKEMPAALRYLPMPIKDVLDERFLSASLKAAIAGPALLGTWLAPRSAGSALTLLWSRPPWAKGLLAPPAFVRGGLGELSRAVASAARARGAALETGVEVRSVLVDDDGAAVGVELTSGASVLARAVVSGVDPRRTLLELTDPAWLEPEDARAVREIRARGTVALVHLALSDLPAFRDPPAGGEEPSEYLSGRIQIGATLDEIERAFDPIKYGELPEKPLLQITIPSLTDPGLAADGKHVMHVWAQYVPHRLASGTWEERRDDLGDLVVSRIAEHAPDLPSRIEHRRVLTPLDLERRLGLDGGCLFHAEPALDQMLFLRPMPGWYRYRTPIENLYLCGPGTHPGIPTSGLSGKSAASEVLADLRKSRK